MRRWGGSVTPATRRAFTFPAPWMVALSTIRASSVTWHHRKGSSRHRPRIRDIPNSRWRSSCQHGCTRTGRQDLRWEACQTSGTETDSGANENDNLDPSLGIFLSTLQVQTPRPPYCETPTLWWHFSSTTTPNNSSSQEAAAQKKNARWPGKGQWMAPLQRKDGTWQFWSDRHDVKNINRKHCYPLAHNGSTFTPQTPVGLTSWRSIVVLCSVCDHQTTAWMSTPIIHASISFAITEGLFICQHIWKQFMPKLTDKAPLMKMGLAPWSGHRWFIIQDCKWGNVTHRLCLFRILSQRSISWNIFQHNPKITSNRHE